MSSEIDNSTDDERYYYDDSEDDDDCGFDEMSHGPSIHPVLEKDIELLKELLPTNGLRTRQLMSNIAIHEIDIDMDIPTNILEETVSQAWGLVYGEPITVRLCVNPLLYLDDNCFQKVDVMQQIKSKQCTGALQQLKHVIETFCRAQFRELNNSIVASAVENSQSSPDLEASAAKPSTVKGQSNTSKKKTVTLSQQESDKEFAELVQMGFAPKDIQRAQLLTDGSKENVVDFLLALQRESDTDIDGPSAQKFPQRFTEMKIDKSWWKLHRTSEDPKHKPPLDKGFLTQLFLYVNARLLTLNDYCVLCDSLHTFPNSMLKPVVCSSPLCLFSFQTLGVRADVTDCIASQSEVVSLLVVLTMAAAFSQRCDKILSPYPCIVDPLKGDSMVLSEKNKNHILLRSLLKDFPAMSDIVKLSGQDLKTSLDTTNVLFFPLLRWIVSSNRCHIVPLPPAKCLRFMHTTQQFLMATNAPAQEERFREYKKKHGSTFAFHGSPIENWHSIIRQGLLVYSGTDKQLNGSAMGKGVYLSPKLSVSLRYSSCSEARLASRNDDKRDTSPKNKKADDKSLVKGSPLHLRCIALCEVIEKDSILKKKQDIWLCQNSDYVCTRFLFVYEENKRPPEVSTLFDLSEYKKKIVEVIEQVP